MVHPSLTSIFLYRLLNLFLDKKESILIGAIAVCFFFAWVSVLVLYGLMDSINNRFLIKLVYPLSLVVS